MVAFVRGKTKATSRDWHRGGGARPRRRSTMKGAPPTMLDASPPDCKPRSHDTHRFQGICHDTTETKISLAGRHPHTGGGPPTDGRWASREAPGYQACILDSVAPVVRPGVDCSKGTALAWVLGLFSRQLFCVDPDLRLSAMWFLTPLYSTTSAWRHPFVTAGARNCPARWTSRTNHRARTIVRGDRSRLAGQVSRPARTASLIRSPSAAPRTSASPAWTSQRPTPGAPPWAYAVSAPR
jgi:hypothetical protein